MDINRETNESHWSMKFPPRSHYVSDPNNLEGYRSRQQLAYEMRQLNKIAPTPFHKFMLMFNKMNQRITSSPAFLDEKETKDPRCL